MAGKKRNQRQRQRGHEEQVAERRQWRSLLRLLLVASGRTLLRPSYLSPADVALGIYLCDDAVAFIASCHEVIKIRK